MDDVRDLSETLSDVGNAVSSVARVADAFGSFDRNVIDAIDSVGRLASATSAFSQLKLTGKDSIFSSAKNLLGSIPVVGDFIGAIVDAWKSVGEAVFNFQERAANNDILRENNAQLEKLRQDLQGFGNSVGDLLGASSVIRESAILNARAGTSGFGRGFKNVEALDGELRAAGSSIAILKRRAEELGITIVDAKGRITAQGLDALNQALLLAARAAANFENDLASLRTIQSARRDIFDIDDPAAAFRDSIDQIRAFAPKLFEQFFQGINVASPAARKAAEQAIRDVFDFITTSGIDLTPFLGGFESVEDFLDSVLSADRALDEFTEATREAAGQMINVASGFAVQNRVFKAIMQGFGDQRNAVIPPTPKPVPIPVGAGGSGASLSINVDVGGLTVGAPAQTKDQIYQSVRRQALDKASALGPTYRDAVEAALPA
jgi:hypothetical protein